MAAQRQIVVKPIGFVHTSFEEEEIKNSISGVKGVIEVSESFSRGLKGIEGFSHIMVVAFLDRISGEQRKVLRVRFKRLQRFGIELDELPEVGVFCSDSPHRPNPIALSIVKLVRRNSRFLHVEGLDLYNGTPVLDLRPYTPDRSIREIRLPSWYKSLERKVANITGIENPRL